MALSMEEQRILAQIEEHLASGDPKLAARLASFGRPGAAPAFRRARVAGPVAALVAVAIVSIVVYALIPFRALPDRGTPHHAPPTASRALMTAQQTAKPASPQAASPAAGPQHTGSR